MLFYQHNQDPHLYFGGWAVGIQIGRTDPNDYMGAVRLADRALLTLVSQV